MYCIRFPGIMCTRGPPCSLLLVDEKTGTLKLNNLSSNMSGKYVCTASNTAGSESCFINLEIVTCT